jgi:hypothetical protein
VESRPRIAMSPMCFQATSVPRLRLLLRSPVPRLSDMSAAARQRYDESGAFTRLFTAPSREPGGRGQQWDEEAGKGDKEGGAREVKKYVHREVRERGSRSGCVRLNCSVIARSK